MKIFLIGFMGSGKSTLGFPLARKMDSRFIDLDKYIEQAEGHTIPEIFESKGEEYFRGLESRYLKGIIDTSDDFVLSTGGGTPCFNDNMSVMNAAGKTVYLKHEPETLLGRLRNSQTVRPLLQDKTDDELREYIADTVACREEHYNRASVIIANPSRDVSKLVEILQYR